jgi:DNA-binding beta-propeller fold protein YncE
MKTLLASTALLLTAGAASAAPAVGLVGDKTLVLFDTETLTVSETMEVGGVDRLLGIDLRPGNGTLVGVTAEQAIVTIDLETGAATEIATIATPLTVGDAPVVVDFNPMADRLRYMTGTANHRVNVDTGETTVDGSLAFEASDMHAGEAPAIVAAAYINSRGKPESTAMYDIDATIGALIRQTSPNDGTLAAVGKLGIDAAEVYAFDVHTAADGTNTAFLAADNTIHTVDLETGAATAVGQLDGLDGTLRDMTVLPD